MYADILLAIGGIGLFLLGMIVLTSGLREIAGGALQRTLGRFTKTPLRGAVAGAVATAIVQSSSATTVMAVGFVSAGLLTFPQGLGIVFGANIGTTVTGWLVALLGFKLNLGAIVLPFVLLGVLMRLFGKPRVSAAGWAIAGFSVLFVGIEAMQDGMSRFEGVVTPADFPDDTTIGRLLLVLIGALVTAVTQSSSAGVAAALVALGAGAISLPQAAALVIGMNVGTTVTAVLATIGGSTATRRTGFAHVIFNVLTSALAFFLLDTFAELAGPWTETGGGQLALVAFHTAFNFLGVILILPVARPFARLVEFLVPERGAQLTRRLDDRLLVDPALAIGAAAATTEDITRHMAETLFLLLDPTRADQSIRRRLDTAREALEATRTYVAQVRSDPEKERIHRHHTATMHIIDHLTRLAHRCMQSERIGELRAEHRLRRLSAVLRQAARRLQNPEEPAATAIWTDRVRRLLRRQRHGYRERLVDTASFQAMDPQTTLRRLDAIRWLHRVSYHLWRIASHIERIASDASAGPEPDEVALDIAAD